MKQKMSALVLRKCVLYDLTNRISCIQVVSFHWGHDNIHPVAF